ncbi:MAG: helix-turn-helix domain-containing protein [Firmicutes bacterium]|nr:helix-turn-helix domain-containing protein [Bacillota bacterium]
MHQNLISNGNVTETFSYSEEIDPLKQESDLSSIGGRIRYYRLDKGMRQEDVALKTGFNRTTITRYENNQLLHSVESCNTIAEAIGISPNLLYDDYLQFLTSDYGTEIRTKRRKLRLTQEELAKELEVDCSTIRRWEKGQAQPNRSSYSNLREFLR